MGAFIYFSFKIKDFTNVTQTLRTVLFKCVLWNLQVRKENIVYTVCIHEVSLPILSLSPILICTPNYLCSFTLYIYQRNQYKQSFKNNLHVSAVGFIVENRPMLYEAFAVLSDFRLLLFDLFSANNLTLYVES